MHGHGHGHEHGQRSAWKGGGGEEAVQHGTICIRMTDNKSKAHTQKLFIMRKQISIQLKIYRYI
jgi:hypothetical protein